MKNFTKTLTMLLLVTFATTTQVQASDFYAVNDDTNIGERSDSIKEMKMESIQKQNFDKAMMERAIELASKSIDNGGGPFGAVITKDGKIVGEASNSVTKDNDPTAHAEVNAIRQACKNLGTFMLDGCTIYTSCEPCPMCLGAIYWSHIGKIYYGGNQKDAAQAGFDDKFIYDEIDLRPEDRKTKMEELLPKEAAQVFEKWLKKTDKTEY